MRRGAAIIASVLLLAGCGGNRSRVESLDEREADLDEEEVPRYQAAATYGPELVDQIDSADALAVFQN